jgi:hypothetical protein
LRRRPFRQRRVVTKADRFASSKSELLFLRLQRVTGHSHRLEKPVQVFTKAFLGDEDEGEEDDDDE